MNIFEWLASEKGQLATAGIAGSAVSMVMEWNGFGAGARRLFVGAVTAYFLGPLGVPMFQWALGTFQVAGEQAAGVGGFIMGIGGVIIVEIILKAFRIRSHELGRRPHDEA